MAVQISGNDITVPRDGSFTRNVTIGGTLTYEDVTNIDSVGLVTARNGIEIGARPGVASSISVDGNAIFSGITTIGSHMAVGGVTPETFGGGHVTLEVAGSTTSQGGVFKTATSDSAGTGSSGTEMILFTDDTKGSINVVSSDPLTFSTANTERARITSAGLFGIGNNNPGELLSLKNTSAQCNMSLQAATNGECAIFLGDTDSVVRSAIKHHNTGDYLAFFSGGNNERLRINSGGKVKIANHGTNDLRSLSVLAPNTQIQWGTAEDVGGFLMSSNNGQFGLSAGGYFNGSSWVAKHTASVQIRTDGDGDLSFFTNTSLTSGNNFTPDEKVTILSGGGLTFNGDTAAANALDDYEEGTFTPSLIYQNSSGLTLATNSASGKYTKIGRVVYILGYINWNVSGSPVNDNIGFGGLPFSTTTGEITAGNTRFIGNISLKNTNAQSVDHQIQPYGSNAVLIIAENNQGNLANELGSGSGFQARYQFWYHAS